MRPIWTGAISFGLVNIPVKIFSAVQDSALDLDMLDKRDHAKIHFKRVNENSGREVPYENIVKAYLYKDKYVVLDEQDFKNADAEKTQTIDVKSFVDEGEIDSIYYEQPYYLQPDKSGTRAYAVFRDALASSGKVGISTFVMRNKEAIAVLKPHDKVIVLNRIRFEEEIRDYTELNLPPIAKPKSAELNMANKLIEQLTEKFDISDYKDSYTAKLLKTIAAKAKTGKSAKTAKLRVVHKADDSDLMEMLKASLSGKKKAS